MSTSDKVSESFKGHHEEIKRRTDKVQGQENVNSDVFERVETDKEFPFELEDQKYFVFSVSHIGMCPFAEKASEPAIRFYGCFETSEEAVEHAHVVAKLDPSCNLQVGTTHKWLMAASTQERLANGDACQQHIDAVLNSYKDEQAKNSKEFKTNVAKHRGGESEPDKDARRKKRRDKEAEEFAAAQKGGEGTEKSDALAKGRRGARAKLRRCVVSTRHYSNHSRIFIQGIRLFPHRT